MATLLVALLPALAGAQTLPAPWVSTDIGGPAVSGSATYSSGRFTIRGAGSDIWGSSDQFRFVYQPVTGDVEIVARVVSITRAHTWSKAGVMIRESLTASSSHAMVVASAVKGYAFQRRPETSGNSVNTSGPGGAPPGWVRLVRAGDLFTAYQSSDGVNWRLIGSDTIPMGDTVYVGLPVTSHNASTATTAVIDSVAVTPKNTPPNSPPAVSITAPVSNTQYSTPASIAINANATDPENAMLSVDFYANQELIARDTSVPYSATFTTSTAGTYSLTAVAHDADGGSTTSGAVSVTVNSPNGAPTVALTSPTSGATFTAPATINVAANASDPENQLSRVEFFNGTTLLGSDTSAPYSFPWTNVAAGTYSLTAKAYDTGGAIATSSAVSVTVSASAGGLPPGQTAADIGTVPIAGSTTYLNGAYTIRGAGEIWGTSDQFRFVYAQVTGDLDVVARVVSLANTNAWAKAGVMIRESLAANSRQALSFISAGNGWAFHRRPTTGGSSVSDSGTTGAAPAWVRLVRTGNLFQAYQSSNGANWTLIASQTITMSASAYVGIAVTSATTTSATTAQVDSFRISTATGNQPPAATLTSPTGGATFAAPATISLAANASDPENQLTRVEFYNGTTLLGSDTSAPYAFSWTSVPSGTYSLTAKAVDASGATGTSSPVSITVASNGAPTVSLTSPTNGSSFTAPATINLAATASDSGGTISRVEFYNGTTLLWAETSAPYADAWSNVAAGTYTLTAVAFDNSGNKTTSSPVTVTVTSNNGAPTVTLTGPTNGASFTAPASIVMTANASDPENQLARVEFYRGTTLLATDTSAPYSWNWTNVAAGTYTVSASAYDSAGNRANSSTVTVTVNGPNGAPTVALTSPTSGATFTSPAIINMAANASDPENQLSRVEFFNGQTLLGSDTSAPYTWSWASVGAGSYTLTAVAVDAAGNRTTSSAATVTVSSLTSTLPRLLVFTASSDHATNVTSYRFDVFLPTANPATATPVVTANLGKPTPASNGDITSDQATLFSNLAVGNYIATVTAIGPGGSTRSATVSFTR